MAVKLHLKLHVGIVCSLMLALQAVMVAPDGEFQVVDHLKMWSSQGQELTVSIFQRYNLMLLGGQKACCSYGDTQASLCSC
jgi:hypothetical protein